MGIGLVCSGDSTLRIFMNQIIGVVGIRWDSYDFIGLECWTEDEGSVAGQKVVEKRRTITPRRSSWLDASMAGRGIGV